MATRTLSRHAPTVSLTSQTLAHDTGSSATDNITNNGAVTLTGLYSGASGTRVNILDGTTVLGLATLDSLGHWTFSTTLGSGTHSLHAVATDLSGRSATTANAAPITVDTSTPTVSCQYETQTVGTNFVQIWGSWSGSGGTTVEIFSGTQDLGAATLIGGNWSFQTPSLPSGNYSFTAVATTVAGNSTQFSGIPPVSVGQFSGTLNLANYNQVWAQDFTTSTSINTNIFPIGWGNPADISFGPNGITLVSNRSEGFANVGFQQADWGKSLSQGYGLYSVTASHPANQGGGIAILLWPSDNIWPGPELDILEDWVDPASQTGTFSIHFKGPNGQDVANVIKFTADLTKPTTYSLDWEKGSLTYYVNGQEIYQVTGAEVPLDAADGGVNSAFGAEIADIGNSYEPSNQVSLTIQNMSYSAPNIAPSASAPVPGTSAASPLAASLLSAPSNLGPSWSAGTQDFGLPPGHLDNVPTGLDNLGNYAGGFHDTGLMSWDHSANWPAAASGATANWWASLAAKY